MHPHRGLIKSCLGSTAFLTVCVLPVLRGYAQRLAIVGSSRPLLHPVIAHRYSGKGSLEKQMFLLSKCFSYLLISPLGWIGSLPLGSSWSRPEPEPKKKWQQGPSLPFFVFQDLSLAEELHPLHLGFSSCLHVISLELCLSVIIAVDIRRHVMPLCPRFGSDLV